MHMIISTIAVIYTFNEQPHESLSVFTIDQHNYLYNYEKVFGAVLEA